MFTTEGFDNRTINRLKNANIPVKWKGWDWDDLKPYSGDTLARVRSWADAVVDGRIIESATSLGGKGLLLYGKPGHGKSALSSVALQSILRASQVRTWGSTYPRPYQPSRGAYMVYHRDYIRLLKKDMDDLTTEADKNLLLDVTGTRANETTLRLLVLDDVGKEYRSDWSQGLFEEIIRDRYYHGWPTIITTNLYPKEWANAYGESMTSFTQEAFVSVEVTSPTGDRRR